VRAMPFGKIISKVTTIKEWGGRNYLTFAFTVALPIAIRATKKHREWANEKDS
jgi:hypothetical protein